MATVRDVVTDALFANGALGQGESLDATDGALVLRAFTRMLGTWANENITVYTTSEGTMTLVAGTATYATTSLSTGRPVSVQNMFLRLNSVDYQVDLIGEEEYDAIPYKTSSGLPLVCLYEASYPNGSFTFYPVPSEAYVAHVKARYPLISGTITLETSVSLPPGYEAALVDNLAVYVAPFFGLQAPGDLRMRAHASKEALRATNHVPLRMTSSLAGGSSMPGYLRIIGDV